MNKEHNSEWKHYLMQFRLQSSRRKKRMQQEDLERKLLQLDRERRDLLRKKRNLGWTKLDPPVMRGYKRYFVLRDDVARSKHAMFFQGILDRINTIQLSDTKSFTAKKRKWGRKIQVNRIQKLVEPDAAHFKRLNFNAREAQFFYEVTDHNRKYYWKKYVFVEPWRFELRVRPNLITKTSVKDIAIEKRLVEIDQFQEQRDLNGKLEKLLHGSNGFGYNKDNRKQRHEFRCRSLRQLIDQSEL